MHETKLTPELPGDKPREPEALHSYLERTSCIQVQPLSPLLSSSSVYYLSLTEYAVRGQHSSTVLRNWPSVRSELCGDTVRESEPEETRTEPKRTDRTDLLQWQDELVERPPLRQARPVHRHVVEQRQHGDLVRRHPVFDAEHVGVHHPVCHHRVEVETFVDARHGGAPVTEAEMWRRNSG